MNAKQIYKSIRELALKLAYTLKAVAGVIFFSRLRPAVPFRGKTGKSCIVVGNGPSAHQDLPGVRRLPSGTELFCVNDFCKTEYFKLYRPDNYVLLEPIYWSESLPKEIEEQRTEIYSALISGTSWPMRLYFPVEMKRSSILGKTPFQSNPLLQLMFFNRTPVESSSIGSGFFYRNGLGMPNAHNVLVASLFLAVNLGFSTIFLIGADHSWHENMFVGDDNILRVRQVRFPDTVDEPIIREVGRNGNEHTLFKLHEIFRVWAGVFASYHQLNDYAKGLGISIVNSSSKTYIDAFKRGRLELKS